MLRVLTQPGSQADINTYAKHGRVIIGKQQNLTYINFGSIKKKPMKR